MRKIKEFQDTKTMTKDEAINEVKKFFRGNKKFIEQATMLIFSTQDFEKIAKMEINKRTWSWENFLRLDINNNYGYKSFCYRKGNKNNTSSDLMEGNKTSDIDEYVLNIYNYNPPPLKHEEYRYNL